MIDQLDLEGEAVTAHVKRGKFGGLYKFQSKINIFEFFGGRCGGKKIGLKCKTYGRFRKVFTYRRLKLYCSEEQ
jgi:hypothetical protein